MRAIYRALIGAAIGTTVAIAPVAAKEIVLSAGCYQGTCFESRFEGKELLKSVPHGQLYAAKFSSREYPLGSKPTSDFRNTRTSFVFCSTSSPAVAWMDEYDGTYVGRHRKSSVATGEQTAY